jgi:hypothetical protein
MSMEKEILEHGFNFNRRRFLSTMSLGDRKRCIGIIADARLVERGRIGR